MHVPVSSSNNRENGVSSRVSVERARQYYLSQRFICDRKSNFWNDDTSKCGIEITFDVEIIFDVDNAKFLHQFNLTRGLFCVVQKQCEEGMSITRPNIAKNGINIEKQIETSLRLPVLGPSSGNCKERVIVHTIERPAKVHQVSAVLFNKHLPKLTLCEFDAHVLGHIFSFCDRTSLDECVVFVHRNWRAVVIASDDLMQRRFEYCFSGKDYDGLGIFRYIGVLSCLHTSSREARTNNCISANPLLAPAPLVSVEAVRLVGCASKKEEFLSFGVSNFFTESIPFAWCGVDLKMFRVIIKNYTVGTSRAGGAFPVEWELQGTTSASDNWGENCWVVLDHQCGCFFDENVRSRTFPVEQKEIWFRKLRIVQTSRNSRWGHELLVSGFEVYGHLRHVNQ